MPGFVQAGAAAAEGAAAAPANYAWWIVVAGAAAVLSALFAVNWTTRSGIIARATMKEAVRQPVFFLLMALSVVMLVLLTFAPYFTLGDDIKMLKDCGLATILIVGLLLALWTSSTSIADEIEGKTAMTLLSKPINRRQFVVGKYLGILQAVVMLLVPVSLAFLALIYYKVGYDARESSADVPEAVTWIRVAGTSLPWLTPARAVHVLHVLPGLALTFLEIAVLTSLSVAISTRLPMVVNMVTCFAVFVIGHLTPVLVQTVLQDMEFVKFTAQLFATVLPSLEVFNMGASVATGRLVPPDYLGMAALYGAAYSGAALLLAFILFEDRDLA